MIIFVVCLFISILIHEFAHMFSALLCGVKVKVFSIGFGKPIISRIWKGIDFRISWIPFGGYCDLKGMESKNEKDDFLYKRYSQKFLILIAGVSANFLLACVCYLINYGSLQKGLYIDLMLIKAMFTNQYYDVVLIIDTVKPNFFLLQLSLINLACAITNILPIPALDGGHIWMVLLEKVWKEKFISYYNKITKISFFILMIIQVIVISFLWY